MSFQEVHNYVITWAGQIDEEKWTVSARDLETFCKILRENGISAYSVRLMSTTGHMAVKSG